VSYDIRFTENFAANLELIRDFLTEQQGAEATFQALLAQLFEKITPLLEHSPRIGRDFLARAYGSEEVKARIAELKKLAGEATEIREYIANDYLILYSLKASTIHLLAIRHHLQLSFDLRGHWL
jgi:hypothetical protein